MSGNAYRVAYFPAKQSLSLLFDDGVSVFVPIGKIPALRDVSASELNHVFIRGYAVCWESGHVHLDDVVRAAFEGHAYRRDAAQTRGEVIPCSAACAFISEVR